MGTNHPAVYSKAAGDSTWQVLTSSTTGLPTDKSACAITVDEATGDVYIAVDHGIYLLQSGASAWSLFYAYPVGTAINFIYFDDLLVGTRTGLYSHPTPATDVEKHEGQVPTLFTLDQNYPNPFNPTTRISYFISASGFVSLKIYDVLGREVKTLVNKFQEAGAYSFALDANELSSGLYFYRLQAGNFVETKKMLLMR